MPTIVKGDGSREPFETHKLEASLKRSGAEPELAERIAEKIAATVKDGMTTTEIYKNAYKLLHKEEKVTAARYSMRRAILDLGPTGYPFEDFVSELMRLRGYNTKLRQIVKGKCTTHEVDVVFEKEGHTIGAELKFHNQPGFKTDLKTALYVEARYRDIVEGAKAAGEKCDIDEGCLMTNTKFSRTAIDFAKCAGITLIGWSYPNEGNLLDMIQETGVYPITVLSSLSKKEKSRLLMDGVALCRSVAEDPESLLRAGVSKSKHQKIIAESTALCAVE